MTTSDTFDAERLATRLDGIDGRLARVAGDFDDLAAAVAPDIRSDSTDGPPLPVYTTLDDWVEQYFLTTFTRPIGGEIRWCWQWREHPEACLRLEALWRSWEALRLDPNLGMAAWLTNYLDPQLAVLIHRSGTFARCAEHRHESIGPSLARS